ncbi:MAG: AAA family ATPase [Nitrospirae bacterium]|nr:AAA family ATPase [Nitrospirota bacterium]MBI5694181.1 AAA family ATPase [Nitrospirota bacterium]
MYEEFYGLKARCFSKTPDPSFLFMSKGHAEALARLQYAVEERDFALLTGGIGSGKTTLSRALIDSLDESYRPLLIINPRLSPAQLLRMLARQLGVERPKHFKTDLLEQINDALYRMYEEGVCPVVIVDEAQLIPGKDTFEEIRLLTNYQLDDRNLLALVIIGQPELRARLKRPAYDALRQRIGMSYHLEPLGLDDTASYLRHRAGVAGREEDLFDEGAVEAIHRFSGGIPRVINNIATGALLSGMGAGAAVVARAMVEDAARDLGLEG